MDDVLPVDGQRFQFASDLLAALTNDGGGLQKLIDIGYKMLGNPIIVTDKSWKAIAMTPYMEIPGDTGWNEFLTNGLLSPNSVAAGIRDNLADRIEQSEVPFKWQSADMKYPRLFFRIVINDMTAAAISVIEYSKPFSDNDSILLKTLCDAISAGMQKKQSPLYSRGMLYEDFLWNLLEGKMTDPIAIKERMNLLNLGIKNNVYVFVFDVREYDGKQFSISYMRDLLEKMISGGRALIYNGKIVIIASFVRLSDTYKTELSDLAVFLKKYNIRCGISRCCTQLSELRFYYEQAFAALRVGTHIDFNRYIYPYGEYAIYHVARVCSEAGGIKTYCHPALEVLIKYDGEHNTNFAASLYAYIRNFKNITNAANALHLHRNTMLYHLRRIEEIMDVSLGDYDIMQLVELTFRLLEYDKKIKRQVNPDAFPG